jgi:hypothetical protein
MNHIVTYLIYGVPIIFFIVARNYNVKLERLKGTGKIPDIDGAKKRRTLFFALAVVSALIILIVTELQFFSETLYQAS